MRMNAAAPASGLVIMLGIALMATLLFSQPASANENSHDKHDHGEVGTSEVEPGVAVEHSAGLGGYGRTGEINRENLPSEVASRVSDTAIALAQSPSFADARMQWSEGSDFVWQVDRQVRIRAKLAYMDATPNSIAAAIENKEGEVLGLFVSGAEAREFERRLDVGDLIPAVRDALGIAQAAPVRRDGFGYGRALATQEDVAESRPEGFGGIWQDQDDGGKIVVALVDPSAHDLGALAAAAGGEVNLKVIQVAMSQAELEAIRDDVKVALGAAQVPSAVVVDSRSDGKQIVVQTPDIAGAQEALDVASLSQHVEVVAGEAPVPEGDPGDVHGERDQMPGLRLQVKNGPTGTCSWGVNGHTSSLNYIVTAGHCFQTNKNYQGWINNTEVYQGSSSNLSNNFHLTPGRQYLYSVRGDGRDAARVSSPQADSNCYHAGSNCNKYIKSRALHNSWEVNSDWVCASLGRTNIYDCGVVQEENFDPDSFFGIFQSRCQGENMLRYDIDTRRGDSGSGIIGEYRNSSAASIDAIHSCGVGTSGAGNTAYHVKQKLGFDFNCASSAKRGVRANSWGSCPTRNR